MWIEDTSEIKLRLELLKESGVTDLERYIDDNPQELFKLMELVRIVDINRAAVDMFKASSKVRSSSLNSTSREQNSTRNTDLCRSVTKTV